MTLFTSETDFEKTLIDLLSEKYGWESEVIKNPTEEQLLQNWADILYANNRNIDRLGDFRLTDGEMQQILEQIKELKTPLKLNGFINGKTISITRDNPDDQLHFGKEVSLKIYDRMEIAAGQSRYQIVQQPRFKSRSQILNDRRGDLMLLINGMPLIHIELKRSSIPVSQAYYQIEKYSVGGIFTGLFSLVQIFVAMTPVETVYFANPGPDGKFNKDFYFHWADFDNELINEWDRVAESLLSIPMAHQLIGFYTVADGSDGILKVMRSYQYFAARAISDRVSKIDWGQDNIRGGYIWHTTGSGKTLTSFKSAQLIANSNDADKVIFLMDRIELGTQSLGEYRNFAEDNECIQETKNTISLTSKLKSNNFNDTLIVTSIQKMSNIKDDADGLNSYDLKKMKDKRIVFIVDEAHRSTFGDMLSIIKETFPDAIFFGFTGTPIDKENQKKLSTTTDIFGDELHRYSIADGIRDKNVLGFDPYKVLTYKDRDIRKSVALEQAKAKNEADVFSNPKKEKVYLKFMHEIKMAGKKDNNDKYVKGIENYLNNSQYKRKEHQEKVVEDIIENWMTLSRAGKFHAIFATSSISEAIQYYRRIKEKNPELTTTALFDPNIENKEGFQFKMDGLVEIVNDYNNIFGVEFNLANHGKFKKDIANRLAHKKPYQSIEQTPQKQLNILIVVDQMLTGFDSKWVNTLYIDKLLKYEAIIQAFSRTNRLFGPDKPFGTIRYYRYPHTMEQNIADAVELYSGSKTFGLFVEHLDKNLKKMNEVYEEIETLFKNAKIKNFTKLPKEKSERGKFAKQFNNFNCYLEAAKVQGFVWKKLTYKFQQQESETSKTVTLNLNENTYLILTLRYKELLNREEMGSNGGGGVPYDIDGYLTEIDTGRIDSDYINTRFIKFLKLFYSKEKNQKELQEVTNELHRSFAMLSQEEQKYAGIFLRDVERGDITPSSNKTLRDYISEYRLESKNDEISQISDFFGLDKEKLKAIINSSVSESTINQYGRFDNLKNTVNKQKVKLYFEKIEKKQMSLFEVSRKTSEILRTFILKGKLVLPMEKTHES